MCEAADDAVDAVHTCLEGIPAQVVTFVAVTDENEVTHVRVTVDPFPETLHERNVLARILANIASNIALGRPPQ